MDAPFSWDDYTLEFHAMVNFLSLRNGGQLGNPMHEHSNDSDEDLSEYEDDVLSEADTNHAGPIATSIQDKLKRKFLDRFAEIVSRERNVPGRHRQKSLKKNQKRKKRQGEKRKDRQTQNNEQEGNDGGPRESFVACACLREHDDHVEVLVTRNNGLDLKDKVFFKELETLFSNISQKHEYEKAREHLWSKIAVYSRGRIFSHLPTLKTQLPAVLEATEPPALSLDRFPQSPQSSTPLASNAVDDENPTTTHAMSLSNMRLQLGELYSLVKALPATLASDHEDNRQLLDISYSLRYEQTLGSFIVTALQHQEAASRCLIRAITFLGRIKAAYFTIISAIQTFPNFGKLKVIPDPPVTPPEKISQPQQGRLSLKQTLRLFKLPLEANAIKKFTGKDLTVVQANAAFMKLQSAELPTHAEIQMIRLLLTRGLRLKSVYPYIGCSLQESDVGFLQQGVKDLRNEVTRHILTPAVKAAKVEATSTADVTSLCSAEDDRFRVESLARSLPFSRLLHMRALDHQLHRDGLGEAVHEDLTAEEEILAESEDYLPISGSSMSNGSNQEQDLTEHYCRVCMRLTVRRCSSCNKYALCSMSCEKKFDYVIHTISCPSTKRPIDSADYLCLAVFQDKLPDDPKTCDDFGFSCFCDSRDLSRLFGLYIRLVNSRSVPSRTIAKWLEEGTLNANIVREYEAEPEGFRGLYYPWFLEHRHIIEKGVNDDDLLARFIAKIEPYLDPGDKMIDLGTCQPDQKRQGSFVFLCGLNHCHPPIEREEWYLFGFCTTVDDHSERELGLLYTELVHHCCFTEFWLAYAQGKLIALMDRKGFRQMRQPFRHLQAFLSPSRTKQSVWHLVWFCRSEVTEAPWYLLLDYGFVNCEIALDRMQLKDTYRELLQKCDPMKLHRAGAEGNIYQFASRYMKLDNRFQRLMEISKPVPEMQ